MSDVSSPTGWQGGLLVKGTFTADPIQPSTVPSMSDPQRLGLALLCYTHVLAKVPSDARALQRWRRWAQAWLEHQTDETTARLAEMVEVEWPYPGLTYLVQAGYQIATGTVLRDLTSTVITQVECPLILYTDLDGSLCKVLG